VVVDVNLTMHINHRRRHLRTYCCRRSGFDMYSRQGYRRASWKRRRARARALMHRGDFTMLPRVYRRDILWKYL
jgi:hypothetical protein